MIRTILLASLACLLAAGDAAFAWTEDLDAAKTRAAAEKKDLLIDFTGSDWCVWCVRLKEEVMDLPAFAAAGSDFVGVTLDFPRRTQQAPAVAERNRSLQERYGIRGFPSIVLCDAAGRPYAKTGYQQGGPEAYLAHLAELRKGRDALLASADRLPALTGIERAKALAALDAALEEAAVFYAKDLAAEIVQLDADGAAGLRDRYRMRATLPQVSALAEAGSFAEAAALLRGFAQDQALPSEERVRAWIGVYRLSMQAKDGAAAIAAAEAVRVLDPAQSADIDKAIAAARALSAPAP
jgi:hypothetical protein